MSTAEVNAALRQKFLGGMSHAACTVSIITTDGPAGRAGVTVSAMSSVSADTPRPTLLVCVHHLSPAADKVLANGVFCVNVLKDDQGYISDTFAGRYKDVVADKFDCAEWTPMPSGAPRVRDPLVGFDCRVVSSERVGTHYVFIGEVDDILISGGSPLVYANRAYGATRRIESATSIAAARRQSETSLSVGCYHTFGPFILPRMIWLMRERHPTISIDLVEGDQRRVQESLVAGETEFGLLYDLDLPDSLDREPLTQLKPYVLLAGGHPLTDRAELAPADLDGYPMVLLDTPPSREYFTALMENAGVTPTIAHRSASFEMVRGLVGHGLGFTILATKPASAVTYDGQAVISRPLRAPAAPNVVLARRRNVGLSPQAERFGALCRACFGREFGGTAP